MSTILNCEEVIKELNSYPLNEGYIRSSQYLSDNQIISDGSIDPSLGYGEIKIPRRCHILKGIYLIDLPGLLEYSIKSISLYFLEINVPLKKYSNREKIELTNLKQFLDSRTEPVIHNENPQIYNLLKVPIPLNLISYSPISIRINVTIDPKYSGQWEVPIICEYSNTGCPEERLQELKKTIISYKSPETNEVQVYFKNYIVFSNLEDENKILDQSINNKRTFTYK